MVQIIIWFCNIIEIIVKINLMKLEQIELGKNISQYGDSLDGLSAALTVS